jgi:hypothetical protein
MEDYLARHEDLQTRARTQKRGNLRTRVNQVFEVIKQQEQCSVPDRFG